LNVTQKPLSELKPGDKGTVAKVGGKGALHRRILDMGIVPGSEIEVVRIAPLGSPVEFKVKGYSLTLRDNESRSILVEVG
jgi:Fe2+ transport system protein FeoA